MGSNIDEFIVRIGFAPDGTVDEVRYWDQEGCGHERVMSLGDDVDDMVQYHLRHYQESHGMKPPRRCAYAIRTELGTLLRCTLDPHDPPTKHRFEVD